MLGPCRAAVTGCCPTWPHTPLPQGGRKKDVMFFVNFDGCFLLPSSFVFDLWKSQWHPWSLAGDKGWG